MITVHSSKPRLAKELEGCNRIVALVGAPNTGKSSLFTVLTGKSATIANWPGVTVDIEIGRIKVQAKEICIVDLPGSYGLVPTSPEESVTRKFLIEYRPDLIVVLLDVTQPEISMSLLLQTLEAFPGKVLVAATKAELAHALGIHIDLNRLSSMLNVKIVRTSALEGVGISELKEELASYKGGGSIRVDYGILEPYISDLENNDGVITYSNKSGMSRRWIAIELLSGNLDIAEALKHIGASETVKKALRLREEFQRRYNIDPEHIVAEKRVLFIEKIAGEIVVRRRPSSSLWQKIADLHMHPLLGPFVSFVGLTITFGLVFSVNIGFPFNLILEHFGYQRAAEILSDYSLSGLLASFFNWLADQAQAHVPGMLGDLIGTGIIGGVGFVASFTPLVMMVYLSLGILEDSGIASRMAVSFHALFRRFGLSGRSIFPLVMSLGCNVPAILSTRALSEEERFRAAFAAPFIPCQARLAVLVAFTTVLVKGVLAQTVTIVLVYTEGIIAALLTSLIAARVIQPRLYKILEVEYTPSVELLMAIPPVHRPHPKVVWWNVRDNTIHFLKKAGTIIFLLAIVLWGLFTYGPEGVASSVQESFAWKIGSVAGMILTPLHLDSYTGSVLGTSLVSGLVAKESVLTTIAIATGVGGESSSEQAIKLLHLSTPQAIGFLVFTSLYFPCIATLSALLSIIKSKKLTALYALYSVLTAFIFGYATYLAIEAII